MTAAIQVVQSAEAAERLLKPERLQVLEQLTDADSATGIAKRLKLPRQTVNYHLRELEKDGFVEFVEHRKKGNCMERVVRTAARSYVISPIVLGALGLQSSEVRDRFSATYLVSAASRAIHDVAILRQRADKAGKQMATLTIETDIRFATAKARLDFSQELATAVANLVTKYHDDKTEGGRSFRFVLGAYPAITKEEPVDPAPARFE